MDIQQIIALVLGALALYFVGRHVWAEARGLINPEEAGGCPGCGGCDVASFDSSAELKTPPLVPLQTTLPSHLQGLRRSPKAPEE